MNTFCLQHSSPTSTNDNGCTAVGDGYWRRTILVTLRFLWTINHIEKVLNVTNEIINMMILSPTSTNCHHHKVNKITVAWVTFLVVFDHKWPQNDAKMTLKELNSHELQSFNYSSNWSIWVPVVQWLYRNQK